jgi:DNA-binding winged helix-turn-helix (wHTH) protein/TolB-like protein/Tfp pilus assembly protein PilF
MSDNGLTAAAESRPDRIAFGDFVLVRSQQQLLAADGRVIPMTPRLFAALSLFVDRAGDLLDKDTVLAAVWPGLVVEENSLSQVVSRLRRLLGDGPQGSRFIETVPRRGFRFVAAVRPLPPDHTPRLGAPLAAAAATGTAGATAPVPAPAPAASPRRRWLLALGAGGTAAVALPLAWHGAQAPAPVTVGVLPFRPLSPLLRDEALEVGMAESLVARLSHVPGVVVRATASAMRAAGTGTDPAAAGRAIAADWIVDGTLLRSGDRLRLVARLVRSADGTLAWSGSFDVRFADVFEVQDRIAAELAQAIGARLGRPLQVRAAEDGGTRNPDAYQRYLAAWVQAQGSKSDSVPRALALLDEALQFDPHYALAWTLVAWTHRRRLWRNDGVPDEVFAASDRALAQALAIAPTLAQARAGLAFRQLWRDGDREGAERGFRAAIAANANEVSARFGLAHLLLTQGTLDEGFAQLRTARELDPLSPVMNALEASYLHAAGRAEAAAARLRTAIAVAPGHGLVFEAMAEQHASAGRWREAIDAQRRAVAVSDGTTRPRAALARYLARAGEAAEAAAIVAALEQRARAQYVPGTTMALARRVEGRNAAALDALERALREHDPRLVFLAGDPDWRPLHGEPRFDALLAARGVRAGAPALASI